MNAPSRRKPLRIGVFALIVIGVAGCGKNDEQDREKDAEELRQVGIMYHEYARKNRGKGPEEVKGLLDYAGDAAALRAYHQVVGRKYVLIWEVNIPREEPEENPNKLVLGYHRDTPNAGGLVLFVDGSVQSVTAAEFADLKKADPEKPTFGADGKKGKEK